MIQEWTKTKIILRMIITIQITSLTIVYSTVYSSAYKRKHQSSESLAFVRGIYRWPVNSPHKEPVSRKMFPFDDVIMIFCMFGIYRSCRPKQLTYAFTWLVELQLCVMKYRFPVSMLASYPTVLRPSDFLTPVQSFPIRDNASVVCLKSVLYVMTCLLFYVSYAMYM